MTLTELTQKLKESLTDYTVLDSSEKTKPNLLKFVYDTGSISVPPQEDYKDRDFSVVLSLTNKLIEDFKEDVKPTEFKVFLGNTEDKVTIEFTYQK